MEELRAILDLWKRARAAGDDLRLATVVRVEGSSYRKPGARMLLSERGERAGTVSGGCLEAEVQKKIWWLTRDGATVQQYRTSFDEDSEVPFGLGCGGTVWLLLEGGEAVDETLAGLEFSSNENQPIVVGALLDGPQTGTRAILCGNEVRWQNDAPPALMAACESALSAKNAGRLADEDFFVHFAAPPLRLFLFGAGDDAKPVVDFACRLGWRVTVADGRAPLARRDRFPLSASVVHLQKDDDAALESLGLGTDDAAVLMTHSFQQDAWLLSCLLSSSKCPSYLGVLGPRLRTTRLLRSVGMDARQMKRLHSPVGLDIGSASPVEIALSIVAQIQSEIRSRARARIPMRSAA